MSYTNGLDKPTDYFNTVLYTGNGSTNAITGVGFQTDFIWNKQRNGTYSHYLFNAITGTGKFLKSDSTDSEGTNTDTVTSFDSDGFTLGSAAGNNGSGNTMVSWNWLASNTTASNTDGSITSTVSANTTSGFSIVKWSGNGTLPSTIGHNLGVAPKMIIVKQITANTYSWLVYHQEIGNTHYLGLNTIDAKDNSVNLWNNTSPTSSVFTVNHVAANASGVDYIAYCFAEKKGFSKFGSYTGNGNADGTFVYTGFKPAFVMVKRTSDTGNWNMMDTARSPSNIVGLTVSANSSGADDGGDFIDILSNGFKQRSTSTNRNASGSTYIYMAFAESPFTTSTGIPTTAR